MTAAPLAIDVRGLHKSFGPRAVVQGLDLRVARGQICGFLGANGSGKTTTLRMLCGLLTPDAGEGTCLELDIRKDAARIRRRVGYMTQRFSFYEDLTVQENLDFVARLYELPDRERRIDAVLQRAGLTDRRTQLAGELSGGWKQRLALAACVLHEPELLLLDEPTAGVDPKARREFWDLIHVLASEGITVLVSTHYMDEAERCHRIVYLAGGKVVVEGSAEEVVARSGLVTFVGTGEQEALSEAAAALEPAPGVESVAMFGQTLRVSGTHRQALEKALAPWRARQGLTWVDEPPTLEDVFIHLLSDRRFAA
ncbi:MAG: ABC transporter ATP-binding protein [Myxococcaceae bacterium]|nr:MAG: ABC transporter ATP-binding protein [Myxococcaceae bacterium]